MRLRCPAVVWNGSAKTGARWGVVVRSASVRRRPAYRVFVTDGDEIQGLGLWLSRSCLSMLDIERLMINEVLQAAKRLAKKKRFQSTASLASIGLDVNRLLGKLNESSSNDLKIPESEAKHWLTVSDAACSVYLCLSNLDIALRVSHIIALENGAYGRKPVFRIKYDVFAGHRNLYPLFS